MIIGMKYCGGCNCSYQRGLAVKRLKERFPEHEYVMAGTNKECDIWIIVCGCPRACADDKALEGRKRKFLATGEKSFEEIGEYLRQERQQAKQQEKTGKAGEGKEKKVLCIGDSASMERTFYKDDAEKFAALTGDRSRLHLDEGFASAHWFGRPVIHGVLVSSLISTVMGMKLPGEGTVFMEQQVKYLAPVFYGDTISVTVDFVRSEEKKNCYIGTFQGVCTNQRGEKVAEALCMQMMMKNLFYVKQEEKRNVKESGDI